MSVLENEIYKLKPSRPIFKIEIRSSYYGKSMYFTKLPNKHIIDESNPVARLVSRHFREDFRGPGVYTTDADAIKRSSLDEIKNNITGFIANEFEHKHPLKTNVGRWWAESDFFRFAQRDENIEKSVVSLWRYMVEKMNDHNIPDEERIKHKNNIINVLSFLYEKYNKTYPTPESRPRRSRNRRRW